MFTVLGTSNGVALDCDPDRWTGGENDGPVPAERGRSRGAAAAYASSRSFRG